MARKTSLIALGLLMLSQMVWAQAPYEGIGLPLAIGQYVDSRRPCEGAPRAATAYYTGTGINAIAICHITEAYTKADDVITQSCVDPQSGSTFEAEIHIDIVNTRTFKWTYDGNTITYRWCQR